MSYETNKRVMDASVYKKEWTLMKKEICLVEHACSCISAMRDYAFLEHHTGSRFKSRNKKPNWMETNVLTINRHKGETDKCIRDNTAYVYWIDSLLQENVNIDSRHMLYYRKMLTWILDIILDLISQYFINF